MIAAVPVFPSGKGRILLQLLPLSQCPVPVSRRSSTDSRLSGHEFFLFFVLCFYSGKGLSSFPANAMTLYVA